MRGLSKDSFPSEEADEGGEEQREDDDDRLDGRYFEPSIPLLVFHSSNEGQPRLK